MPPEIPLTGAFRTSLPARLRISTRLRAGGLALALLYAFFFFGFYKTGFWINAPDGRPLMLDFLPVWLAGREALLGHVATAYNFKDFVALQTAVAGPHLAHFSWSYPPTYLLLATLVAGLPYVWAFLVWQAATLSWYLAVGYRILRDPAVPVLILASPASALNVDVGQNGFLTGALTGSALLLLERQPWLAGCLIGAMFYKPQLAVLFPIILIADGRWRALIGAAATAIGLGLAAGFLFGMGTWVMFPKALLQLGPVVVGEPTVWGKFQSVYGLGRALGLGAVTAVCLHLAVALAVTAATATLWRSRVSYDLKAAALAAAALAVTPYLFGYDLAAIAIAAAFFQRDRIERGGLWGERIAAFILFGGLIVLLATSGKVAIGPVVTLGLFGLILRRSTASLPIRAIEA